MTSNFKKGYTRSGEEIKGLLSIHPNIYGDDRGFFFESWNQKDWEEILNINNQSPVNFVQDNHSKSKYPKAKIFGITTALPVMIIIYELGYKPVTFSELTDVNEFWIGCKTCKNYDVLKRTKREMCLCTGMLYEQKIK